MAVEQLKPSLKTAHQHWKGFDLDSRRPILDQTIVQAKEKHKESLSKRKKLAEITKKFKKATKLATESATATSPDDASVASVIGDVSKEGKNTVKAYQEEIDSLTRRCKAAEGATLTLYQSLYELPDPTELLLDAHKTIENLEAQISTMSDEMVAAKLQSAEAENAVKSDHGLVNKLERENNDLKQKARSEAKEMIRLKQELEEYEAEFSTLKNQDITIRKLEEELEEMRLKGEQEISDEVKKAQDDLAETEGRRVAEALEREAALERKLESVMLELKAERAGRQSTQAHLLEASEGTDELEAAWEAQRLILVDDGNRLREQLYEVTRERDDLRLRVSIVSPDESSASMNNLALSSVDDSSKRMSELLAERAAYDAEVNELTITATTLRDELKKKDLEMLESKKNMQSTIDSLEAARSSLSASVSSLQADLDAAPSVEYVEQMKRELRILKRLEYNVDDGDEDDDHGDPEMTSAVESEDVESILVSRLKKMEANLLRERREKNESISQLEQLKKELVLKEEAKGKCEGLIATLEADLQKAINAQQSATLNAAATTATAPTEQFNQGNEASTLTQILDPNAPPAQSPEKPVQQSKSATDKADDDHSVATIVMAQRDRLRVRCDAMEAERDSFKRELQVQVSATESLKLDNTKLYEKVKYLQNFSGSSGSMQLRARNDRDLDLEALEQRYEASVDPFRQFSASEKQRKLNEMTPVERIVFMMARQLLTTKQARTALFFYILGMHFLVFMTTYHWSHSSSCDLSELEMLAHMHHGPPRLENDQVSHVEIN